MQLDKEQKGGEKQNASLWISQVWRRHFGWTSVFYFAEVTEVEWGEMSQTGHNGSKSSRRLFDKNVSVLNWASRLCQPHIV